VLEKSRKRSGVWTIVGAGIIAAGAAGVGGGIYLTTLAGDSAVKADSLDPMDPDYDSLFAQHMADADTYNILSYVGYGVGVVAAVVGLDILLSWPIPIGEPRSEGLTWSLFPLAQPGGGTLMFQLDFP